jgi:mandelamide amidase
MNCHSAGQAAILSSVGAQSHDPSRVPGSGTSSSAAAVAARIAPLAIAEYTRLHPRSASDCGLAGLRPTLGQYPDAGIMPLGEFDQVGPVARSG